MPMHHNYEYRFILMGDHTMMKLLCPLLLFVFSLYAQDTIAILPLGSIDTSVFNSVLQLISKEYNNAKIELLNRAEMPTYAYYKPRKRYRAERLLSFLDTIRCEATKIVGLTDLDISTTKGEYVDWGIFGYGSIDGKSCVCSIYRLKDKGTPEEFNARLRKLITHELGHTYGLDHCAWPLCVMADYKGTMASLDRTGYHFCAQCKKKYSFQIQQLRVLVK
jgi:archaemetzincin